MHQDDSIHQQPFHERRTRTDDAILLHIQELQAGQKELQATTKALDNKMTYHHGIFRDEVEKSVERVFERSFPNGDPEGHRRHHELVIAREEARVKFWNEMVIAVTKWAGVGVLGFLAHAAWVAFLKGPGK